MAGIFHPSRGGVRGGQDQFNWDDVKTDKDRENYLGHSVMVPIGKWQEGKDLIWYTRDKGDNKTGKKLTAFEEKQRKRREEIQKMKDIEAKAMAAALGHKSFSMGTTSLTAKELQEVLSRGQTDHNEGDKVQGMGYKGSMGMSGVKKKKYGTDFEGGSAGVNSQSMQNTIEDTRQSVAKNDELGRMKEQRKEQKKRKKTKKKKKTKQDESDSDSWQEAAISKKRKIKDAQERNNSPHNRKDKGRERSYSPQNRREKERERRYSPHDHRDKGQERNYSPHNRKDKGRERSYSPQNRREKERERRYSPHDHRDKGQERNYSPHNRKDKGRERSYSPQNRREKERERRYSPHNRRDKGQERNNRRNKEQERSYSPHNIKEKGRERSYSPHNRKKKRHERSYSPQSP